MDKVTQEKWTKLQTANAIEKQMRKLQRELRRLKPKVEKSRNNYSRILKNYNLGEKTLQAMSNKRDSLLKEFTLIQA